MNRELLMLAQVFEPAKHSVGGWYYSTKLDGMRGIWDGGLTRGMLCSDIPFANVAKHDRFVEQKISTGLWSRYGQTIHAPDWWLDSLPKMILDGELYQERGGFQFVTSTVKQHVPDERWKQIKFFIFDSPPPHQVFTDGKINNVNFKKTFKGIYSWFVNLPNYDKITVVNGDMQFMSAHHYLINKIKSEIAIVHLQHQLPLSQSEALKMIEEKLQEETKLGGEGLMLRKRESWWEPKRSHSLLKVKKYLDSEAKVIGYTTGRQTDLGSKLLGLMGAMIVEWHGKTFELSGFTEAERVLCTNINREAPKNYTAIEWCKNNPGCPTPHWIMNPTFPLNSSVSFKYRELTDDGIPKEARYWRKES